jgi:hypothetical protein
MSDLVPVENEITKKDISKDRRLKLTAATLPVALSIVPSTVLFVLSMIFGVTPSIAAVLLFFSFVSLIGGFILGGIGSAATMIYRSRWLAQVRERVAINGIKAKDVEWFKNEMKSEEKKALKEIKSKNLLLADAYQETLASRLTATRIVKSTRHELLLAKRRKNKLKYLKSERVQEFNAEVDKDIQNLSKIKSEADEMLIEAQSRLQMIEAASRRGSELAGNELALKKLSARTEQLPLALEAAKLEEETRREIVEEIEAEFDKDITDVKLIEGKEVK